MKTWWIAIRVFFFMTILTGIFYPLAVTGVAQLVFSNKANGSLIDRGGEMIGSEWIAQKFEKTKYLWPRPSAVDYNPQPSGGSNLGPTSADLKTKMEERRKAMGGGDVPQDLLFASASGLDPEISPEAMRWQLDRIAAARALNPQQKQDLMKLAESGVELPVFGFIGSARVNVLKLNLLLDEKFPEHSP